MIIYEISDDYSISLPLSKAKLCATLECSTIHIHKFCPKCGTEEFLFLEPIINQEKHKDKFFKKYRYCSGCNAKYQSAIIISSGEGKTYHCPVCNDKLEEINNENVLYGKES